MESKNNVPENTKEEVVIQMQCLIQLIDISCG